MANARRLHFHFTVRSSCACRAPDLRRRRPAGADRRRPPPLKLPILPPPSSQKQFSEPTSPLHTGCVRVGAAASRGRGARRPTHRPDQGHGAPAGAGARAPAGAVHGRETLMNPARLRSWRRIERRRLDASVVADVFHTLWSRCVIDNSALKFSRTDERWCLKEYMTLYPNEHEHNTKLPSLKRGSMLDLHRARQPTWLSLLNAGEQKGQPTALPEDHLPCRQTLEEPRSS